MDIDPNPKLAISLNDIKWNSIYFSNLPLLHESISAFLRKNFPDCADPTSVDIIQILIQSSEFVMYWKSYSIIPINRA